MYEVMFCELRRPRGDPDILAAESREQYFKLKKKLQILTFGIGGIGLFSAYVSYSPEITASFGAGFLGSSIYIPMIGSSVDFLADGAKGIIKGAIGQPMLLVPVVLVMIFWTSYQSIFPSESMDTALMKLVEILWVQLPRRMSEASFISSLEMSWRTSPTRIVPTFYSSCKKSGPGELSDCGTVICVPYCK